MLNLALKDLAHPWTIWEQELQDAPLNPGQPSYWADTWAIANHLNPKSTNRFLIGADQALSMHRWHRYQEFWKDAVVILRDDANSTDKLVGSLKSTNAWSPGDLDHWRSISIPLPLAPFSSTDIRNHLSSQGPHKNTRIEGLDPGVHSYILKNGLYR